MFEFMIYWDFFQVQRGLSLTRVQYKLTSVCACAYARTSETLENQSSYGKCRSEDIQTSFPSTFTEERELG